MQRVSRIVGHQKIHSADVDAAVIYFRRTSAGARAILYRGTGGTTRGTTIRKLSDTKPPFKSPTYIE